MPPDDNGEGKMRLLLSRRGKPLAPIVVSRGATETERYAAEELRQHLTQITGAPFEVRETDTLPERAIVVGHGALTERLRPDLSPNRLGAEEVAIECVGNYLLLTGGRPRGTLYAVYRFLHGLGVRWWTPWAAHIPRKSAT
jgi:hypothetical protein